MELYVTQETIEIKSRDWMQSVERVNKHGLKINKDKSALLVIDMQNYFLDTSSPAFTCGGPAILPNIKKLISAFRNLNRPVIYTKHVHHPGGIDAGIMQWWWEGMCIEGSPESAIHADIAPLEHEKIVLKHRYSAFFNTDLDTVLRCLKIEDLVITGVMTNMCCESTARDAYFRDYRVFFPADGTGSVNEEMHKASLLNLAYGFAQITTADTLIEQMQNQV
ncbi:MAG: amidase [Chlorobi bacterium OLB5]|nr:MAG: amidase [Chlorobi bacterium OLB5]